MTKQILTITKDVEADVFIAKMQMPVIYSQGVTKQQAFEAIEGAVTMWVNEFFKRNKL